MRVLFVSAPLPGHLDWGGYLATAQALGRRGHRVLWASGEAVRDQVARAGLDFHSLTETGWRWPPPPPLSQADITAALASTPPPSHANQAAQQAEIVQQLRQLRALDQWLDPARVAPAVAEMGGLVLRFTPDLIVSEMFVAASGLVAEQAAVPFVVAGWPAPPDRPPTHPNEPILREARRRLSELCDAHGLGGVNWTQQGPPALSSPLLHVTYWCDRWYAPAQLGEQTRHVGGRRADSPRTLADNLPTPNGTPWVLITQGTSFNPDHHFYLNAARAVERLGGVPIIATGRSLSKAEHGALLRALPATAWLGQWVDLAAVLPETAAAIHHGGAGTTHALALHGVPQVVVPLAADQHRQAQSVARTGCGFFIAPRQATIDNLANALAALLPDLSPYRAQAAMLQQELHELGGVEKAATLLEATMDKVRSQTGE